MRPIGGEEYDFAFAREEKIAVSDDCIGEKNIGIELFGCVIEKLGGVVSKYFCSKCFNPKLSNVYGVTMAIRMDLDYLKLWFRQASNIPSAMGRSILFLIRLCCLISFSRLYIANMTPWQRLRSYSPFR